MADWDRRFCYHLPIVKRATITAGQQEFLNLAIAALATLLTGVVGFALYAKNLLAAQCGFLAVALWIFFGVHFARRHRLLKEKTMGILTPTVLIAAILTTLPTMFLSGPIIGLSKLSGRCLTGRALSKMQPSVLSKRCGCPNS